MLRQCVRYTPTHIPAVLPPTRLCYAVVVVEISHYPPRDCGVRSLLSSVDFGKWNIMCYVSSGVAGHSGQLANSPNLRQYIVTPCRTLSA